MNMANRDTSDAKAKTESSPRDTQRRRFLRTSATAAAGFTLAMYLPGRSMAQIGAQGGPPGAATPGAAGAWEPNAFVRVGADNTVTVLVKHLEMGQGTFTGLPTLVAEEMDAAWGQMRVEAAPADASRYNNLLMGPIQGTGGSTAMANSYDQLRKAGASARSMLVAAAAKRWNVPPDSIRVANGVVSHSSGKKATFGELASAAAQEPVPADVPLKDPKDFVYIGKRVPRTAPSRTERRNSRRTSSSRDCSPRSSHIRRVLAPAWRRSTPTLRSKYRASNTSSGFRAASQFSPPASGRQKKAATH